MKGVVFLFFILGTDATSKENSLMRKESFSGRKGIHVDSTGHFSGSVTHRQDSKDGLQSSSEEELHVFTLTNPSKHNAKEFFQKAQALGYTGKYNIAQINETSCAEKTHPVTKAEVMQMSSVWDSKGQPEASLTTAFINNATKKLTRNQISLYLSHRHFWVEAARLPSNAWAIVFEDDADLRAGPEVLRHMLLQAEQAAGQYTGKPAALMYLKQCLQGTHFMQTFMRDSSGYAIRPNFAKQLLAGAHGDVPVYTAMKNFAEGGLCGPLISSDDISSPVSDAAPKRPHDMAPNLKLTDIPDQSVRMFVLTSLPTTKDLKSFTSTTSSLGYTGDDSIEAINNTDSHEFFPSEMQIEKLGWTKETEASKRKEAVQKIFRTLLQDKNAAPSEKSFPTGFVTQAMQNLSPTQIATYLGHRRFWEKAAQLPKNSWAVLFQDNARLVAKPEKLKILLKESMLAARKLWKNGNARLVYLKPCETGEEFSSSFLRDATGYAIRADTAQDLLNHAQADASVASAIKHVVGGGLCVPMIETAQMSLNREITQEHEDAKKMMHNQRREQREEQKELEETKKELDELRKSSHIGEQKHGADTAPDLDLHKEAAEASRAASKPIQESITDTSPETRDPTSDMRVFVLSVPSHLNLLENFLHIATKQGYVGTQEITRIMGTDSDRFYPTDSEIKDMGLSSNVLLAKKQNAIHQMIQSFAAEAANAGQSLPENFEEAAIKKLSPKQVAKYVGHMRFWLQASKLPPKSWAVMLEDDADVMGGPTVMRNWLQQAEKVAGKLSGEAQNFIYLRQCAQGKEFAHSFLRDSAGYAIRPATAKALLGQARGDEPVNLALKDFTKGGLCAPLLLDEQITEKEHNLAQQHHGVTDPPISMFVLTVPRHHNRMVTFRKESNALGFKEGEAIQEVSGIDFSTFYPEEDKVKHLKWSEKDQELEKKKAIEFILSRYKNDPAKNNKLNADKLSEAFANEARQHLSPEELATYLGHRQIWQRAAELPSDSWAVILENDAIPLSGPDNLHGMLKQADMASLQQAHAHAHIVYLKPCPLGRTFMEYFMRDAMGYAIRPHVAKALLHEAPGAVSVASAIKAMTKGGVCVPFIK